VCLHVPGGNTADHSENKYGGRRPHDLDYVRGCLLIDALAICEVIRKYESAGKRITIEDKRRNNKGIRKE
jgi:hypothetical protein